MLSLLYRDLIREIELGWKDLSNLVLLKDFSKTFLLEEFMSENVSIKFN
jgi:hypothetical protein